MIDSHLVVLQRRATDRRTQLARCPGVLTILAILSMTACGSSEGAPATIPGSSADAASSGEAGPSSDGALSDDESSVDAGPSAETGPAPEAGPVGLPITAPPGQWTWVPFPDSACGNGSPTGIGINRSTSGARVLLYLEGGGACWSELTCYTLMTAANFGAGYSQANFASDASSALAVPGGFFDRTAAANPFKDYSYVYVPYCTGDIHAGSNTVQYGAHTAKHVGFANMTAYLKRLVPTFASADRVVLTGSSAGGFGATYNWGQTQAAFGRVRVDLIDDSGPFMPPDVIAEGNHTQPIQTTQWNLAATAPTGCTACMTDSSAIFGFYAKAFPMSRGALLAFTQDTVLPGFFGITTAQFTAGLEELLTAQIAPSANLRSFLVGAQAHVMWFQPSLATNGVTLQAFVRQMVTDDPSWASQHP